MGVSAWLAKQAARTAHVLVVEAPGRWLLRVHVEEAVRRAGWQLARSPADADVLLVCGKPGPDLDEVVERLWEQLPGPRVRREIDRVVDVDGALIGAAAELVETSHHREDARSRAPSPQPPTEDHEDHGGDEDHEGHDDGGHEGHEGHGGGHDHGGHGHGDHGDHGDMAPGGIPLAEGAEDRDGLEMDVLHVPLGPVLPHWPGGLVLTCTLHGDLVADAEARLLPEQPAEDGADGMLLDVSVLEAVRLCDAAAATLALAGSAYALDVRRVRDELVRGARPATAGRHLERTWRRMTRSRSLRWSLRRTGVVTADQADDLGLGVDRVGDCHDRLGGQLEHAVGLLREDPHWPDVARGDLVGLVPALPAVVRGLDLAAVRLTVASLDLPAVRREEVPRAR